MTRDSRAVGRGRAGATRHAAKARAEQDTQRAPGKVVTLAELGVRTGVGVGVGVVALEPAEEELVLVSLDPEVETLEDAEDDSRSQSATIARDQQTEQNRST